MLFSFLIFKSYKTKLHADGFQTMKTNKVRCLPANTFFLPTKLKKNLVIHSKRWRTRLESAIQ